MAGKKAQQEPGQDEDEDINVLVDKITSYMGLIRRKLLGDEFASLPAKMYSIESFDPEPCPECGQLRTKFFMLLQPGDDLFDATTPEKTITNFKVFCLDCTKKINMLPRKDTDEGSS
jgi:hypothetical protein